MTEQISSIVLRIQGKFQDLHQHLLAERERNNALETELRQAKILLSANQEEISKLNEKNQELLSDLSQINEQLETQKSEVILNKDAEIDELVREIDNCISQLKQ